MSKINNRVWNSVNGSVWVHIRSSINNSVADHIVSLAFHRASDSIWSFVFRGTRQAIENVMWQPVWFSVRETIDEMNKQDE